MAQQKVSDTLFEALDIIINKRIEAVQKDKTILCVVEDASKASEGEYIVSNSSAKFTAYSENTNYRNGQNVWVLIPEGDYNNEKRIIGKHAGDSSTPYIYVDPMDSYANMTGNILNNNKNCIKNEDEYIDGALANLSGLVANYSAPINIFSGERLGRDGETQLIGDENVVNLLRAGLEKSINNINGEDLAAYDRLGISADFKTTFGSNQPINGSYGLFFIITTAVQTNQTAVGETPEYEYRYIPVTLDSSQMWGNPYNYANWSTQKICYDINTAEQGTPVGIDCYFYQNFDFNDGEYPYQYEGMISLPNLFVKDINVSFGYAVDNVEDDTLFLFTKSNNTYIVDNDDYQKDLQARFIYVADDNTTRIAINSVDELKSYFYSENSATLSSLNPIIRWYRYNLKTGVSDLRAGDFWEEFYPDVITYNGNTTVNLFAATIQDLHNLNEEKFKCILCYNNKANYYLANYLAKLPDGEEKNYYTALVNTLWLNGDLGDVEIKDEDIEDIWKQWAQSDQRIVSKELVFINQANAYDSTQDLVQALRLTAGDPSNGVFNIYEASYGANNHLINSTDERVARKVKATFWSAVTNSEEMNEVERLAWYVPRHDTMIKRPEDGLSYGAYTEVDLNAETYTAGQYYTRNDTTYSLANGAFNENNIYYEKGKEKFLDTANAINNLGASISDEERSLFLERIKDYYIILEDDIQTTAEKTKEATLVYYIKPELKKHWTHNTIRASAYRYKRNYEGENAEFTPTFGVKGTNGTDYTLSLEMRSEVAKNEATYNFPPAWTWIDDDNHGAISNNNTISMQLYAQLYDPNDKEVEGATYTWEFLYPANGKINNAVEWTISADRDDSRLATLKPGTLITNYNSTTGLVYRGAIIKCTAAIAVENKIFTRYFTIPMRRTREYIGFEGPTQIRYASSGTQPQYYNTPIGLFDIDENIIYNNTVRLNTAITGLNNDGIEKYLPVIKQDGANKYYHLFPKAMYFKDVNYGIAAVVYNGNSGQYLWSQPLLILIDPYGNEFLNNWGGELNIDYDNNTIMSAVMGAGKKESDNSFTGLLLGDLPKVTQEGTDANGNPIMVDKTGLLGYEHGEKAYGIFDDGTMFLGKSSRAQLKFNGTEGLIQNAGYDYGHGIKIDFDGGINTTPGNKKKVTSASTNDQHPYIDIKDANGAQVYLSTDGTAASPYLKVKSPNATGGKDLLHIESASYYLQTENYKDATSSAAGAGLKIDLANGILNSYDKLTINGATGSKIHFGNNTNYIELGYDSANGGYLISTGKLTLEGGIFGQNNSVYLSTENKNGTVANQAKSNWRLTVGSNFGVDADGNMLATNGNLAGKITANEGTIGGFNISSTQNTAFNGGHFYVNSLYSHPLGIDGKDYEVGMQGGTTEKGLAFYVKRKNANEDWIDKKPEDGGSMENLFYVRNNGELYAQNAKIRGTIYADAGEINGSLVTYGINAANISTGYLDAARIKAESLSTGKISGLYAYVQDVVADTVTASYISATSAEVGSLSISNGRLSLNKSLTIDGSIYIRRTTYGQAVIGGSDSFPSSVTLTVYDNAGNAIGTATLDKPVLWRAA